MTAIKTVGLTKKYKDLTAVDSLDLEIEQGEVFALLGVNGAGKTTTVKMLLSSFVQKRRIATATPIRCPLPSVRTNRQSFPSPTSVSRAKATAITINNNLSANPSRPHRWTKDCGVFCFPVKKTNKFRHNILN